MKARKHLVWITVLGALAACTTEKSGSASAGGTSRPSSPGTPGSTTSSSTERVLPPRPRDLDLTGVDPCTDVLTRDQLHQLAYDLGYQRLPRSNKSGIHQGPTCLYASTSPPDQPARGFASLVAISTSEGVEVWLTDPRRKVPPERYRVATVADFPALILPNPHVVDNCDVLVDVHAGQYLEVNSSSSIDEGTSPEPYCAEGQRVAEMIIQNLSARR